MEQPVREPFAAGKAAMQAGRLQEAIDWFLQAVQQEPNNERAWSHLGAAHMQRGEMDHAISAFRRAAQSAPQSARAQYNLGYALQTAGRIEEARGAYQTALQMDPNYGQAQQALASLPPGQPQQPPAGPVPPAPVGGTQPSAPVPPAPVGAAEVPPAPVGQAAPAAHEVPPAPVGGQAEQEVAQAEAVPALAQGATGSEGQSPGFELGVQPGPGARPDVGRRAGPAVGPRKPLPSVQPPAQPRHVMTTVGAGLTTGARIGKGVLAGAIAAVGTGITAAVIWGLVRLVVEAATRGDKADIKSVGIMAVTNAIALIPALIAVGIVIGVIAGAAGKPRIPSFLMVLCALGWGAYGFLSLKLPLDKVIVPVFAAIVYVLWFGVAFESQFRARAEDVLGEERERRGRRVT